MIAEGSQPSNIEVRGVHTPLTSYYIKIKGGYPLNSGDTHNNKKFKIYQAFEHAALRFRDKSIIISYIEEPMLFLTREHLNNDCGANWFEFLHDAAEKFNFPVENVSLYTSNIYATESYEEWCKTYNITSCINVFNQARSFWINRLIKNGCKYIEHKESKHITMFLGRPTLLRNFILRWYLTSIVETDKENKILSTFFYDNFHVPTDWNLTDQQLLRFRNLPGTVENNLKVPHYWPGDTEEFRSSFLSGLVNFNIDFHENEDFHSYDEYLNFKKANTWWKENTISEKTFRSILYKKPFIRLGMPGSLNILKQWGFKTFDGILFDESYDEIDDCYERVENILIQVEQLLSMPFQQLKEKVYSKEVQDVINHNYELAHSIYNKKEELVNV